jgi:protocatechuate 3,4-dioxygenase alpha subunit
MAKQTASQTVGPYFKIGLTRSLANVLVEDATEGRRIRVEGRVLDGEGQPVVDAMIEIWQANTHGRYDHPEDGQDKPLDPAFKGFGRTETDAEGRYWFATIKPGPVPGPGNTLQAPHIGVVVFARGMPIHTYTRIYFADEAANATDPVLTSIADGGRRGTLITGLDGDASYIFDIVLQGAGETVFFDT